MFSHRSSLTPWLVGLAGTAPRWVVLAVAGATLFGLGTSYERRLRQAREVRVRLVTMR